MTHQSFQDKVRTRKITREVFVNDNGAIDLASIMVGIIVIGLIGAIIAATIFAVIPWAQDNAAKQQLDAVKQAQNAYRGLAEEKGISAYAGKPQLGGAGPTNPDLKGFTTPSLLDLESAPDVFVDGTASGYDDPVTKGPDYIARIKSASGTTYIVKNGGPITKEETINHPDDPNLPGGGTENPDPGSGNTGGSYTLAASPYMVFDNITASGFPYASVPAGRSSQLTFSRYSSDSANFTDYSNIMSALPSSIKEGNIPLDDSLMGISLAGDNYEAVVVRPDTVKVSQENKAIASYSGKEGTVIILQKMEYTPGQVDYYIAFASMLPNTISSSDFSKTDATITFTINGANFTIDAYDTSSPPPPAAPENPGPVNSGNNVAPAAVPANTTMEILPIDSQGHVYSSKEASDEVISSGEARVYWYIAPKTINLDSADAANLPDLSTKNFTKNADGTWSYTTKIDTGSYGQKIFVQTDGTDVMEYVGVNNEVPSWDSSDRYSGQITVTLNADKVVQSIDIDYMMVWVIDKGGNVLWLNYDEMMQKLHNATYSVPTNDGDMYKFQIK